MYITRNFGCITLLIAKVVGKSSIKSSFLFLWKRRYLPPVIYIYLFFLVRNKESFRSPTYILTFLNSLTFLPDHFDPYKSRNITKKSRKMFIKNAIGSIFK